MRIANGHPQWTGQIRFVKEKLDEPLRWKKPRRIFVNSMSDLFHPNVTDQQIFAICAVMAGAPHHVFQVLTKRPERMVQFLSMPIIAEKFSKLGSWPAPHIWWGTSCEDQDSLDKRLPHLLAAPVAMRWLSLEPLLGPIELPEHAFVCPAKEPHPICPCIDWVVVGGESGPGARPMHPQWARDLRDQCEEHSVPFFFKQWGAWLPIATPRLKAKIGETLLLHEDGTTKEATWNDVMETRGDLWAVQRVGKRIAGAHLDNVEWKQYPE